MKPDTNTDTERKAAETEAALAPIKEAIKALSTADAFALSDWLKEYAEDRWDADIERDAEAGLLDALAEEARKEHRAGKTLPLPGHSSG